MKRKAVCDPPVLDHDFIKQHCTEFGAFADKIRAACWAEIVAEAGLTQEGVEQAARVNAADTAAQGLREGQIVSLESIAGDGKTARRGDYDIP